MIYKGFGIILVIGAIYFLSEHLFILKKCCKEVTGILVYCQPRVERSYNVWRNYYVPVYFYEVNGNQYYAPGKEYSKYAEMFEINKPCKVRYNPANPEECVVNGKTGKLLFTVVFCVLGCIFLFL